MLIWVKAKSWTYKFNPIKHLNSQNYDKFIQSDWHIKIEAKIIA